MDASEVLCEGPLEQRSFVIFWSPRWCVMNKREFLIYTDEEASLLAPEKPLERYNVLKMSMAPELHAQSVLRNPPMAFSASERRPHAAQWRVQAARTASQRTCCAPLRSSC